MPENRKSPGKIIVWFGMHAAIVFAVSVFLIACSQNLKDLMVGYWTPGKSCDRRFFEMTIDLKFYQWEWEKNWDGYGRNPNANPSTYALTDNNVITVNGVDSRGKKQNFTGKVERISEDKIKILNVKATRDNQAVKDAPTEIILTRCEENIAEQLKK